MKKDATIFLKHILESIDRVQEYSKDLSKSEFRKDVKGQDAVFRRLEIMGEAVKNIPPEFTKKYPQIPWTEIARTRDKLIHHYFGVDLDLTYDIIRKELPKLRKELVKILQGEGG